MDEEIGFILTNAAKYLSSLLPARMCSAPSRDLRPLVRWGTRKHSGAVPRPHDPDFEFRTPYDSGGKWTTYRKMAETRWTKRRHGSLDERRARRAAADSWLDQAGDRCA